MQLFEATSNIHFKHFVYSITSNKNLLFSKDGIFVYIYGNKTCTRELI